MSAASLATFWEHFEECIAAADRDARTAAGLADAVAMAAAKALRAGDQAVAEAAAATATATRVDAGMSELRAQMERMQLELREVAARPAAPASAEADVVVARVANLGWDTEEDALLERARAVLAAADSKSEDIVALPAAVGRTQLTSACEAAFASKAAFSRARIAVRGLRRECVQGRAVWLGYKQTPEESRAVKMVRKVAEMLRELEGGREPPMQVTKDMGSRSVMVGGR